MPILFLSQPTVSLLVFRLQPLCLVISTPNPQLLGVNLIIINCTIIKCWLKQLFLKYLLKTVDYIDIYHRSKQNTWKLTSSLVNSKYFILRKPGRTLTRTLGEHFSPKAWVSSSNSGRNNLRPWLFQQHYRCKNRLEMVGVLKKLSHYNRVF